VADGQNFLSMTESGKSSTQGVSSHREVFLQKASFSRRACLAPQLADQGLNFKEKELSNGAPERQLAI
jgi:hypothetical protein